MTQSTVFGAVPPGSGQQVLDDLNLSDQALATEHEGDEVPAETYPWMRWRNDTAKLLYRRDALNSAWEILENYGATADPTTGDDSADGYVRGSLWINVTDDRVFWCTNPAPAPRPGSRPGPAARCDLGVRPHRRGGGGRRRLHRRPDRRRRRQGDDDRRPSGRRWRRSASRPR